MKNNLLIYLVLAFSIASCETVVDIDVPIEPPKLVVSGTFDSFGNWHFSVTKSMHILDVAEPKVYDSAVISVFQGGSNWFTVPPVGMGKYFYYSGAVDMGKEFSVTVEVPKLEMAMAFCELPKPPETISLSYDSTIKAVVNNGHYMEDVNSIEIVFDNDISVSDYYMLSLQGFGFPPYYYRDPNNPNPPPPPDSTWNELHINTDDPIATDGESDGTYRYMSRLIFSDELINGKQYTLRMGTDQWHLENAGKIRVLFSSISKDGYLFLKTLKEQRVAGNDPFSEPVNVHSNIENGYGIFYGIATDTLEIRIR
ncbi:MAG: DUF4249 domain-containing protein [Cyclobacteriaceae bacterium]|nr:DUF4249 domain-containing protein [Cyclobacteriaceae bacterium]